MQPVQKSFRLHLRIHLLMGYDSFKNLSTWTEAHDLIRLISGVAVASRLEQDAQHATDSAWALTHNPQLQIKFLGHHPYEKVSSTELLGKK